MKNISNKPILILAFVLLFATSLYAQSSPPSFTPGGSVPDDVIEGPISGLISVVIIVGAMLGYKKLKK